MAEKELHEVSDRDRETALARAEQRGLTLSGEQPTRWRMSRMGAISALSSAMPERKERCSALRASSGGVRLRVRGVALSGVAENLESGSGIASRTIASMEHGWKNGRDMLTA